MIQVGFGVLSAELMGLILLLVIEIILGTAYSHSK